MVAAGTLSSRGAKDVLVVLKVSGGDPEALAKEKGLLQVHDVEALRTVALWVIGANPQVVGDFKAGKEAALQYLVGQAMKATKGAGNPGLLKEMLTEELKK
jgi:aspartyl-tRNA(Asn)/glutamyl-tRNA(Gln) amidotransferase subunit B